MASTITEFSHLQISLEDVLEATNHFDDKNVIGHGGLGKVYKGKLLRSGKWVNIAARRLDSKHKRGIEFWTEISALSSLKHENIVSIIGFCDEKGEKVIINKHEAKRSLVMYLSNPTLSWVQRLKICVGVARALSYIHYENGRSYSVIHRNINSSTILLDNKFEPKLSGFEYSINHSVQRMDQVLFSEAIGTTGYIDPSIQKTRGVTYKSDVYSFGVVLWEVLCGRKAFITNGNDKFLAPVARFHYEDNTVNAIMLTWLLQNRLSLDSVQTFTSVAYSCLNDERVLRPDMTHVIYELEKALEFQLPYEIYIRNTLEHVKFQVSDLKIRLADIMLATDNFSEAYHIGGTIYYDLYKSELELFDKENVATLEEKNSSELSKTRVTVVIKRVFPRKDIRGDVFATELEMLKICNHCNIVTLLGVCDEGSETILVFEHASNGYLREYLFNIKNRPILTWAQRLKICLDVSHAINYLHYEVENQKAIINCDIRSATIVLDENWGAKIADFGFSVFLPPNLDALELNCILGYDCSVDPEFEETGKLTRESDVYGFGVVLFEILCGRIANDDAFTKESDRGLAFVVRRCFHDGTLKEMIDPIINNECKKDSLDIFIKIAYQCLSKTQDQRPTIKVVIKELERALSLQEDQVQCQEIDKVVEEFWKSVEPTNENLMLKKDAVVRYSWDNSKDLPYAYLNIRRSDILLATDYFSKACIIGNDGLYDLYKAELLVFDQEIFALAEEKNKGEVPKRLTTVCLKCFHKRDENTEFLFRHSFMMYLSCNKHRNIGNLLGLCDEGSEMILVLEYPSNGFLYDYLKKIKDNPILTWAQRLRICLDVAYGLKYLHYEIGDQKAIIHRELRSSCIGLDENWGAKILDHGFTRFSPNEDGDALHFKFKYHLSPTSYRDPEFTRTGTLKRESDVYSLGVIMFEILCGRTADNRIFKKGSDTGLASVARRCFHDGTMQEIIDPILKNGIGENNFSLNKGPNKKSLNAFLEIAYKCLGETQDQRPTSIGVVEELEKALYFQENNDDGDLRITLEDIKLATKNFHVSNCVGGGGFGNVYKGKLPLSDDTIVAKKLDTRSRQGEQQFRNELQILFEYKHENIISLVGYCDQEDAKIIVYAYAPRGSLDRYLSDGRLDWIKRLNICIDVATALNFLHRGIGKQATVIHRDIKTANVLLTSDWKAKLADFGLSLISAIHNETDYVINRACGTPGYVDPLYLKSGFLTKESDIYSFGVVLFEMLCGRSTFETHKREGMYIPSFIKHNFENEKREEVVFEKIKAQIMPKALTAFRKVAYRCLRDDRERRPKAKEVVKQLKKALRFQMLTDDLASTTSS
ncbi:uncharacterized protein [Rutidosis leptorrhynchoides]|uniref:uncharacterized protein n=1 Tax=Rutidosis leptorrhynchoides TaxID=125765 RepID=UPI003A99FB4D